MARQSMRMIRPFNGGIVQPIISTGIGPGGGLGPPVPPVGFVFVTDSDGVYLTDTDNTYLLEAA